MADRQEISIRDDAPPHATVLRSNPPLSAQPGDTPVYRFFDTCLGTHFYTANAAEAATMQSRPELTSEGIAFYAPR